MSKRKSLRIILISFTVTMYIVTVNSHWRKNLKALANEDTLLRTHCCPWCFLGCANWETFVADTKCFWTKSETFFVSRTQNLCPQQMLHARANEETFVSATMCPQQCVLVCQGLKPNWPITTPDYKNLLCPTRVVTVTAAVWERCP